MDPDYFDVGDDGRLTLLPGRQGLRGLLYFKTPGTYTFEKAS
ncbi:hypothetical protein [Streptomyces sp. NPDC049915]